MQGTSDDRYLEWLSELVGAVRNRNPARSYSQLLRQFYTKEFVWLVANDDNRIEDAKELRYEFVTEQGSDGIDSSWMDLGCSVLEVLIGLSRRASFETDLPPEEWFWRFVQNIGLDGFTDEHYNRFSVDDEVDEILERIIFRTYNHSGRGGLFPLTYSPNDQRKVELWYQLAEYLREVYPV